jgi:hypothetical protein
MDLYFVEDHNTQKTVLNSLACSALCRAKGYRHISKKNSKVAQWNLQTSKLTF